MARVLPPLDGFLEAAVYVESIERSVEFYRNTFGFEVIETDSRLIALRVGLRQVLLVCKRGASLQLPTGAHDGSGPLHLAFAHTHRRARGIDLAARRASAPEATGRYPNRICASKIRVPLH